MNQHLAQCLPVDIDALNSRPVLSTFAIWHTDYQTGHPQIDREHQELFELVNTLHNALQQGAERSTVQHILTTLVSHTQAHFYQEELLMVSCDYPRYERHKQSHGGLNIKMVDLLQKFSGTEDFLTIAVTQFLTDWLVHHIQGEDRKMIDFLQNLDDPATY